MASKYLLLVYQIMRNYVTFLLVFPYMTKMTTPSRNLPNILNKNIFCMYLKKFNINFSSFFSLFFDNRGTNRQEIRRALL